MNKNPKKPSQLRAFLSLAWYSLRAQTRNPATFFFGFIFPIVFISIFGLIGNSSQQLIVGIPTDYSNNSYKSIEDSIAKELASQNVLTVERADEKTLEEKLKQGKIAGIVQYEIIIGGITEGVSPLSEWKLITSSANPQQAGVLKLIVNTIIVEHNLKYAEQRIPKDEPLAFTPYSRPNSLKLEELSGKQLRYIDFALPGQIGFSLLSTAIFGTVFGLIYLKKALVLKRMFATPTKPLTILLAQGASRLIIALLQTLLIIGIGVLVFQFFLPHGFITFFELLILSVVGLIAFLGFGYFMAGLANDENAAGPLVNLVTLPQFLLSGTFFSTENLPTWLQPVANNLPLSYFNIAVRKVTTEGGNLIDTWPYMLGLLIWGAGMYILAAKTFKWE